MSTALPRPFPVLVIITATTVAVMGVAMLWIFDPNASNSPFPACVFQSLTGFYCIGCGITRALHALVHGDVLQALRMNPLAIVLLPIIPLMVAHARGWQPRGLQPLMKTVLEPKFWLILLPAYWIARNLPWAPFNWLAPG